MPNPPPRPARGKMGALGRMLGRMALRRREAGGKGEGPRGGGEPGGGGSAGGEPGGSGAGHAEAEKNDAEDAWQPGFAPLLSPGAGIDLSDLLFVAGHPADPPSDPVPAPRLPTGAARDSDATLHFSGAPPEPRAEEDGGEMRKLASVLEFGLRIRAEDLPPPEDACGGADAPEGTGLLAVASRIWAKGEAEDFALFVGWDAALEGEDAHGVLAEGLKGGMDADPLPGGGGVERG